LLSVEASIHPLSSMCSCKCTSLIMPNEFWWGNVAGIQEMLEQLRASGDRLRA
jgi:hypothetical protein